GGQGLAQQLPYWQAKLANVAWSEAHGKDVILHSWNATRQGNVFGLASMLLVANGRSSYSASNGSYRTEYWYPEYRAALKLGPPLGADRRLRSGAYERMFNRGVVVVNPTGRSVRVSFGKTRYSGSK